MCGKDLIMETFEDLPTYMKEELTTSSLLSAELSFLTPTIQRELGETVIDILNKLPTKEWMIAGGFMAFVAGHTKWYGDIDVFLYKFVSKFDLGDEWEFHSTIGDSWIYNFFNRGWWYYNFPNSSNTCIVYNHRTTKLQLIVPMETENSFLDHCSEVLMTFDIEYCKLGWIGTTKMVMDLRGIRTKEDVCRCQYREEKYQRRLVNKQLPVPRLSLLAYLRSKGIHVVYTLGVEGFVRRGLWWGEDK